MRTLTNHTRLGIKMTKTTSRLKQNRYFATCSYLGINGSSTEIFGSHNMKIIPWSPSPLLEITLFWIRWLNSNKST